MSSQPTWASAACARSRSARSLASDAGRPNSALPSRARRKRSAPIITFSSTVRRSNSPTPWSVRAIPSPASRSGLIRASDSPRQRRVPESGATNPQIRLNSVVLPAPLGPITPTTSPPPTSSDTPSSAVIPPKRTVASRTIRPMADSLASTGASYTSAGHA